MFPFARSPYEHLLILTHSRVVTNIDDKFPNIRVNLYLILSYFIKHNICTLYYSYSFKRAVPPTVQHIYPINERQL